MKTILVAIRHFLSPAFLFAAFLLVVLFPILEVSCDDKVQRFTVMELVSPKGPLMEREKSPHASLFEEDDGPSREERLDEDAKFARNLRWSLWGLLGLTCLGAVATALVFRPRIQGVLATLLGFGGYLLMGGIARGLLQGTSQDPTNSSLQGEMLPAWDRAQLLVFFAGWAGATTFALSFRAKGLEPIARWGRSARGSTVETPASTVQEPPSV
ncbi:MAG TPA: hypothetical protein PKO15_03460 [Fibrobacteria bacterium]|nr:hypothetical protein [Fibrobacteria bacterium]